MATFFGEVIESTSRAFWDDDDDSEDEKETEEIFSPCIKIRECDGTSLHCQYELIIIVCGKISKGFARSFLFNSTVPPIIALFDVVDTPLNDNDSSATVRHKPSVLRKLSPSVLLFECSDDVDITIANKLTSQLSPWLEKCTLVTLLSSCSITDYKSATPVTQPTILRCLTTDSFNGETNCLYLEQPNIISGFAASVLSWCQVKVFNSVLYTCYTDSPLIDSITVAPFVELFKSSVYRHLISQHPNLKPVYNEASLKASNMYL